MKLLSPIWKFFSGWKGYGLAAVAGGVLAGMIAAPLARAPLLVRIAGLEAARADRAEAGAAGLAGQLARIAAQAEVNAATLSDLVGTVAGQADSIAAVRGDIARATRAAQQRTIDHADADSCVSGALPDGLRDAIAADRAAIRPD